MELTPAVLSRINQTILRDPGFASLMHLAGSSKASTEQLRALGAYIQALARETPSDGKQPLAGSLQGETSLASSNTHFTFSSDLIIEFSENRNDRWLIPKDSEICQSQSSPGYGFADVSLSVKLAPKWRFSENTLSDAKNLENLSGGQHSTLNFHKLSKHARATLSSRFNQKSSQPETDLSRSFLQYRIDSSALLGQLETLNSSKLIAKLIKPSPYALSAARRATSQQHNRKPTNNTKSTKPNSIASADTSNSLTRATDSSRETIKK